MFFPWLFNGFPSFFHGFSAPRLDVDVLQEPREVLPGDALGQMAFQPRPQLRQAPAQGQGGGLEQGLDPLGLKDLYLYHI